VGTSQTKGLWANGGSIPGPSAIDHFPILAMGGEYMLRQPARSAIDQTFGPAFLNRLNQADSWLGTGSRGTAASQGPQLWGNGYALGGLVNPIGPGAGPARIDMGVDYTGAFDVYALGAGTIRNVYNSGWPGGTFIDIQLNPPYGSGYWYSAENIAPSVSVGQGVSAGQKIGHARGSYPFTEFGWATGQGGQTAAARDHQIPTSGDPGAWSTAWGVAASQLIHSLGGPAGIFTQGSPGGKGLLSKIKGFLVSLWQNAEGLLNAAGNAVSSKLAPVGKFIAGGGKELLALAKKGARAVIDGIWDHTVTPIVNLVPSDSMPGEVLQLGAAKMKEAIDSFFSTQDKNAQAQAQSGAPGNLPAAAGPIVAYAKKLLAAYGWSNQWPAFNNLEMHEAGYDPHSQNPHSTAYGIGQFLDSTWATVGGTKTSDPYLQLQYMMKYIKQRYGDPNAAWAQYFQHPGGQGSYALGGVVIEQIKRATRNQHIQEAMALATYLDSGWNSNYSNQKANEYGAFAQRASKTHPASTWHNIGKAVALMMPRYQNGIGVVGPAKWGRDPEGAAKSTADWAESRNLPKLHGQAAVDRAWKEAVEAAARAGQVPARRLRRRGRLAAVLHPAPAQRGRRGDCLVLEALQRQAPQDGEAGGLGELVCGRADSLGTAAQGHRHVRHAGRGLQANPGVLRPSRGHQPLLVDQLLQAAEHPGQLAGRAWSARRGGPAVLLLALRAPGQVAQGLQGRAHQAARVLGLEGPARAVAGPAEQAAQRQEGRRDCLERLEGPLRRRRHGRWDSRAGHARTAAGTAAHPRARGARHHRRPAHARPRPRPGRRLRVCRRRAGRRWSRRGQRAGRQLRGAVRARRAGALHAPVRPVLPVRGQPDVQ
jgi:hypothetical protein